MFSKAPAAKVVDGMHEVKVSSMSLKRVHGGDIVNKLLMEPQAKKQKVDESKKSTLVSLFNTKARSAPKTIKKCEALIDLTEEEKKWIANDTLEVVDLTSD